MTLTEIIRGVIAGPKTSEKTSAHLRAHLALVDSEVTKADQAARDAQQAHTDRALEHLGDLESAAKSRRLVEAALAHVETLRTGRAQLAVKLDAAVRQERHAETDEQWRALLDQFELDLGDTARLQQLLDDLASTCRRMIDGKLAIWQALPERPKYFPPTFTTADLLARIDAYLSGASSGLLGESPNAFVASQRPDLVSTTEEAHRLLLSARTVPATTTT